MTPTNCAVAGCASASAIQPVIATATRNTALAIAEPLLRMQLILLQCSQLIALLVVH